MTMPRSCLMCWRGSDYFHRFTSSSMILPLLIPVLAEISSSLDIVAGSTLQVMDTLSPVPFG